MTSQNGLKNEKNIEITSQLIKDSQDERMHVYGYERNLSSSIITFIGCILTVGSLRLFFHWYPHLYLYATHKKCSLRRATKVLIVDDYQGKYKSYIVKDIKIVSTRNLSPETLARELGQVDRDLIDRIRGKHLELNLENGTKCQVQEYKAFSCKKQSYVWDDKMDEFSKLTTLEKYAFCMDLHTEKIKGLSREEQLLRRIMYGYNEILVPVQSFGVLFVLEILNPFYVFQVFSLIVWYNEGYIYYAIAVICMSACGIISSIRQTRTNQISLRNTVASTETVRVLRSNGEFESISSDELVPGDIIELPKHRAIVTCDAILLTGTCVVNESMLTGESVPVTKTPLQSHPVLYDSKGHSHHTLFSGTSIIQTKQYGDKPVLAKVIRTGLWTNKGSLVVAILYPPPSDFKFDQDSYKLIAILIGVAFVGFFYTLAVMTGTLTEDGLDMMGVIVNSGNKLSQLQKDISKLHDTPIFKGMLVCHSLTLIDDELSGDPLDVKMFESTGWSLEEPEPSNLPASLQPLSRVRRGDGPRLNILQQYQFSSTLQRMSVIARPESGGLVAFTKGSPEMVLSLSSSQSVPSDVLQTLGAFTEMGYRVIALASKPIDVPDQKVQNIPREEVEKDLEFLGLIILENRLKEPTVRVIEELRDANIKTIMITGDNIQTAISVAKECGIVSHEDTVINVSLVPVENKARPELFFNVQGLPQLEKKMKNSSLAELEFGSSTKNYKFALTGDTWQSLREHYDDILPRICTKGVVFARMSSDQKQQLVMELIQLGYHVAMCGDGANDCGALRAAHVGISLSEAESSVASPFTSRVPDITCVPTVIQQGRAALVTSFGIFKFTVCYSLTEFISTIILYSISSNFTGQQFFYVDVLLFVNFAFFFGKTEAYDKRLAKEPPTSSLISFTPMFSMTMHTIIVAMFELLVFNVVQHLSWFTPFEPKDEFRYDCYENYSVFCVSTFQYAILAIVFSMGKPYRKAIYTNMSLLSSIVVLTLLNIYITVYPAQWVIDLLELQMPPVYDWRWLIIGIAMINFLVSLGFESFVVEYVIQQKIRPKLYKPEKSKKKYLLLEHDLKCNPNWPPISKELPNLPITPSYENIINSTRKASIAESAISVCIVNENEQKIQMSRMFSKDGVDNLAFRNDMNDVSKID